MRATQVDRQKRIGYSFFVAQRPKPEVRARILTAAELVFAAQGYQDAKMASIAEAAGLSAGNLYRYFTGKAELFDAVIDREFLAQFDERVAARVRALAAVDRGGSGDSEQREADRLLEFWIEHRLAVVILLDRAQGSRYADHGERFVASLVDLAVRHLEQRRGGETLPDIVPLMLETFFHTSRRAVVAILERYETRDEIRRGFEAFWSFQLPGLAGFEEWVMR